MFVEKHQKRDNFYGRETTNIPIKKCTGSSFWKPSIFPVKSIIRIRLKNDRVLNYGPKNIEIIKRFE